jgi:hypothetical protein
MNTLLLGFDCRRGFADEVQHAWNQVRRERYLLRVDVRIPVSVDTVALPSVFDFDSVSAAGTIQLQPMDFHQQALRLWRDLAAMRAILTGNAALKSAMQIAIILHCDNLEIDPWWRDFLAEPITPAGVGNDWTSIGFDVADRYLTSALSNCGYEPQEKVQHETAWVGDINEFGLISELSRAVSFRDFSDSRVQGHAPFYVFEVLTNGRSAGRLPS